MGRNFAETIHELLRLGGDAEAVVRHFNELDAAEEREAARARRVKPGSAPARFLVR
jgi:hypothetical protein